MLRVVPVHHPADQCEARFSIPHSIAACFLDKEIGLESYTIKKAGDPRFHAFREKVKMISHPEWEMPGLSGAPIPLTVMLKDGTEFKVTWPSSDTPCFFSDQEVVDRYVDHACTVLSSKQAEQSAKIVLALDEAKDIAELMNIITFPEKH